MKKIISLFQRNYDGDRLVRDEIVPGAEWVVNGEGVATLKVDGTACLVRDGRLYRRYDAKKGRTSPLGWEACEDEPNAQTGHWPGWLPVGDGPEDKWHREAYRPDKHTYPNGTYELVGPKVQGNPYRLTEHHLWLHGIIIIEPDPPRTFTGLREWFDMHHYYGDLPVEGIVWWRRDYEMDCDKVKIKRGDFGLPWPVETVKEALRDKGGGQPDRAG